MNQKPNRNRKDEDQGSAGGWFAAGAIGMALAGAAYWLSSSKKDEEPEETMDRRRNSSRSYSFDSSGSGESSMSNHSSTKSRMGFNSSKANCENFYEEGKVSKKPPPDNPCLSNLNALLADIYVRFIQLRHNDFQLHFNVFDKLFQHLHIKMMEVDNYYRKYSSTRQFAGSHYDNLRIKKPDEFDMDIVIRLPLNLSESPDRAQSDILIEPHAAGYVHLRMGKQFQNLPLRDGVEWENNKAAYGWMDDSKYLLRTKFMYWWKSVVNKALNTFVHKGNVPIYYIDGVEYEICKSESGLAMTLYIVNRRSGFKLDVDLVPALKFPESRWPITSSYRQIPPGCCKNTWMVVGKVNKAAPAHEQERSWRIALHNQERELMHGTYNLRQAVRLIKKLRDELGMKKIASYYIKVLFFWEIVEQNDKTFWQKSPAYLFTHMLKKLHAALVVKNIPYFWNRRNNLIEHVDTRIISEYAAKLVPLLRILDDLNSSNFKLVAKYLLSNAEFKQYNEKYLHV